jgi:hypothetical protein
MEVKEIMYTVELSNKDMYSICQLIDIFRSNKQTCNDNPDLVCNTNDMLLALSNSSILAQKFAQKWLIDEYKKEVDRLMED